MNEYKLPMLPPKANLETKAVLKALARASRALAELKGYADTIPNKHILINAVTINEAKDSSAIENIITTHDDLYKAMSATSMINSAAKEVVSYRSALWLGYEKVKENEMLTINMIVDIQGCIENNRTGIRKLPGTVLMNEATGETVYTPPSGEIEILYLVLMELLSSPILYLSSYIIRNKSVYYELLQEVRTSENWEEWIVYILTGIEETSEETLMLVKRINDEVAIMTAEIKEKLPKLYSKELIDLLFYEFYTKIQYIEEGLSVSRRTAVTYLQTLEKEGFLVSEKIGKERIYQNKRLYNLVTVS